MERGRCGAVSPARKAVSLSCASLSSRVIVGITRGGGPSIMGGDPSAMGGRWARDTGGRGRYRTEPHRSIPLPRSICDCPIIRGWCGRGWCGRGWGEGMKAVRGAWWWWCSIRDHPDPRCKKLGLGGQAAACQGLRYRRSLCARRTVTAGCTRRRLGGVADMFTPHLHSLSSSSSAYEALSHHLFTISLPKNCLLKSHKHHFKEQGHFLDHFLFRLEVTCQRRWLTGPTSVFTPSRSLSSLECSL